MSAKFKVVDLFAGPGGLAEGFASATRNGDRAFDIALSVEKDPIAFRTLRLRSFYRQFVEVPPEYYEYIAGRITRDQLTARYPDQWTRACAETRMLTLGTDQARFELDPVLQTLRDGEQPALLIGGPPCQAYSTVGRARNRGVPGYQPANDDRYFLYREYVRTLARLQPVAFVMENVTGILTAKVGEQRIFEQVLSDLTSAGGAPLGYKLFPLAGHDVDGRGFVVPCERYGIPQARHRVIIVGIRRDIAERVPSTANQSFLSPALRQPSVRDCIEDMPALRSGLSREPDTDAAWSKAASEALRFAADACKGASTSLQGVEKLLIGTAAAIAAAPDLLERQSSRPTAPSDNELGAWLCDARLANLPNHDTRPHRRDDLARYAFVAAFGEVFRRSPKAKEFPPALAPAHRSWKTGDFADRFRVQLWERPSTTITSHISKDGHYFIHPDLSQCRSLTVREAARLQTFPDNYFFEGERTQQFHQVGNAVPPLLARQIAEALYGILAPALTAEGSSESTELMAVA